MPGPPVQLILARSLLSSLSTPAFLVDQDGNLLFFNEAAGVMLGRRYEETGKMRAEDWTAMFGPFDENGEAMRFSEVPLTAALRGNRPAHAGFHIRSANGVHHEIQASAFPLIDGEVFHGALVVFWPAEVDGPALA